MRQALVLFLLAASLVLTSKSVFANEVAYQTAKVDGLDIFYREAGPKDGPTILLLHGLPSSSRMYQQILESKLSKKYHMIAPDYPGFGHSSWPDHKEFAYTFDHLSSTMEHFCEQMHLDHYVLFMQDYGGPVGFRMALHHPEQVSAMVIQNAAAHEEGLSPLWEVRRAFWNDRARHEDAVRKNLLSLEATKQRHLGTDPQPERYNPDLWVDEYYFLNRPNQGDIQIDLFYDYQNNVKSYGTWQTWLQQHKPPLLVLWGRYDPSFTVAGVEGYKKDDPNAEVHILDAGHFAFDTKAAEMIDLTEDFLSRQIAIGETSSAKQREGNALSSTVPVANDAAKEMHGLQNDGEKLKAQAAKVDENESQYNRHAQKYLSGKLHQDVVKPELQVQHVSDLHKEFKGHVASLKSVVEDYRTLFQAYTQHYWQYQRFAEKYRLETEQAKLDAEHPGFRLAASKESAALNDSEKRIADVLKKMSVLQAESPHLAESYLCPAFDDLKKQFVVAIGAMTTSIQALPPEQARVAAHAELVQIQELKTELEDAEALKNEQITLNQQLRSLKEDLSWLSKRHVRVLLPDQNASQK